jgi:hypothetical protein
MAKSPEQVAQEAQMNALMRAPVSRIYANGFGLIQTASDLTVVMLHNNNPAAMVSMSFISAKSLLVDLEKAVSDIEAILKHPLPTIGELVDEITKIKGEPSA